jgi:hypothetical protein
MKSPVRAVNLSMHVLPPGAHGFFYLMHEVSKLTEFSPNFLCRTPISVVYFPDITYLLYGLDWDGSTRLIGGWLIQILFRFWGIDGVENTRHVSSRVC